MSRGAVVFVLDDRAIASGSLEDVAVPAKGETVEINAPPGGETAHIAGRYRVTSVVHRVSVGPTDALEARSTVFVDVKKVQR